MANLRITGLNVRSSAVIEVSFTNTLNTNIAIENVAIQGAAGGVDDLTVLSVSVSSNVLTINVRPMIPRASYKLTLGSTDSSVLSGAKGETFIEDGATNIVYFVGQIEENIVRDEILADLPPVYNTDPGTLIFDLVDAGAREIEKAEHILGEIKSSSYVSIDVEDESLTRGSGPFDRLGNEAAFQLIRVGSTETGTTTNGSISYDEFPSDAVSLRQVEVEDEVISNSVNDANQFKQLIVTVANRPIVKLISLSLIRNGTTYDYDIEQYRYGILEDKFDTDNAYPALDIDDNQIKLSTSAVGPTFPLPQGSDEMVATYLYAKPGRNIDSDTVEVTTSIAVVREGVSSVATSFFLDNAPIINSNGIVPSTGGVVWLNPSANFDPSTKHPAFITELVFNTTNLPSSVGQFMVNYETGQVIVFGADGTGVDGTTTIPPVANYSYLKTFQNGLDYNFFSDLDEIASVPGRDLRGSPATISFQYEDTFAEGTDFIFSSHVEVLSERVENRLIDTIGVRTLNYPVTEVFRIFNETTGEIYTPSRISGNEVYFSATNPPVLNEVSRESASFAQEVQSQIVVTDEILITSKPFVAFRVELSQSSIIAGTGDFIGASFNSSLVFSDASIFAREMYYDSGDTLDDNLIRLESIGDYMVNYLTGVVYVAVTSGSGTSIGDATFRYGKIKTRNQHIVRVDDIYRSTSPTLSNVKTLNVSVIEDQLISMSNLEEIGETTYTDPSGLSTPILVVSGSPDTITVDQDVFRLRSIYQVTDLQTTSNPINFASGAVVSSSSLNVIRMLNPVEVLDDNFGAGLTVFEAGSRKYVSAERIESLFTLGIGQIVDAVAVVGDNTNYYAQGSDGYVDSVANRIYLPTTTGASVGELVEATYTAKLNGGAAVLVDYTSGDLFVDYTYSRDEILISYEHGDNVLDWSISSALSEGEEYFATYRYGALRTALRDNFGVLTSIEEIANIPDELDRETYRNAVKGSLQTFSKGPTIPAIEQLVEAFTQITPLITESVFFEWILGRDHLSPKDLELLQNAEVADASFAPGKFGEGIVLSNPNQTATIYATSKLRVNEGTLGMFVTPDWDGLDNDAMLTFDLLFDGVADINKVFIGADSVNPESIPFTLSKDNNIVLGRPSRLHSEMGYFVWYDTSAKRWRMRTRSPISEQRLFSGTIRTSGDMYNVSIASSADGYDGYDGYEINELNDSIRSTDEQIKFSFVVDAYDSLNMSFDAYDSYSGGIVGFDGLDFTSDNRHYFFDTAVSDNRCRMTLFKDGRGFLRYQVYDENGHVRTLSTDISDWETSVTYHVAVSWKLNTTEMQDEMHLFVDGQEVPNTFRFGSFIDAPMSTDTVYMDSATEVLAAAVTSPTVGGFDLKTIAGSDSVTSLSSNFSGSGVSVGSKFVILDDTLDGIATQTAPYVYVKSVVGQNQLDLEIGPPGSNVPFYATSTLNDVKFSVNPIYAETNSNPFNEKVQVFSLSGNTETELFSPNTLTPDYGFSRDGYQDYINIYNGIPIGGTAFLRTYGLQNSRCKQLVYIWPHKRTNIMKTIMPPPTSVSKINITALIVKKTIIEPGVFFLVATPVGSHIVPLLVSNLTFCQPSNEITGRRFTASIAGSNLDFSGINQVIISGTTYDGSNNETITFSASNEKITTSKYFTSIDDIIASFTPIDPALPAGVFEIREALPINRQENGGNYAEIRLSVQDQAEISGQVIIGESIFTDGYARFGAEDIGKTVNIISPPAIAGSYKIEDIPLDPSGEVRDSQSAILNTTWPSTHSGVEWVLLNTSYGDSGFANGLITLEIAQSGGLPYLLRSCWYEVDIPSNLIVPWCTTPELLYIGSDSHGNRQADAIIDEFRILDELSLDTGRGESTLSSGRSITTDAAAVREYEDTAQTLALFHFDSDLTNSATFSTSFEKEFRQSENSVNSNFGQSVVFDQKKSLEIDNKSVFQNNEGTIEFWVSPILDTHNDPTNRYYFDLTPEQVAEASVAGLNVVLPARARSVSEVSVDGTDTNYFVGGKLAADGQTVRLGQQVPPNTSTVSVTFVPITSQGDRVSIYKNRVGQLVFLITASGVDYQITTPVFWKKNTWHRVFAGWSLNNDDNQDRMVLMTDGLEGGVIRYGTGLRYGVGHVYGQPSVWGSAQAGTLAARNISADINLIDNFNTIHIGADFTGQFTALARMDNIRISSALRDITLLGGEGPGQLLGRDLLYTSNTNTAQPVVEDALTRLLLDFDTDRTTIENIATVRSNVTGIFDFYVTVIDTFELADTDLVHSLITQLINRLKPAHTRAFVDFTK